MNPRPPDGIPAWFRAHTLFTTADPVAAERLSTPLLGRHRLVLSGGSSGFTATLAALVIGPVTLGYLTFAAAVEVELAGSAPRFLVGTPTDVGVPVCCGPTSFEAAPDRAAVLQPGRTATLGCPAGCTWSVVGIERRSVHVQLSRILGRALDGPLVFDTEFDLGAGAASRWNLAIDMLHAELSECGSLFRSGIGHGQLDEFLMSSLLYGQGSTYADELRGPKRPVQHPATGAARRFIDANLSERLTLATVAAAARVSPRTLQAAFRADLRTTPTAYIRSRRLDLARADLVAAAFGTTTVTDVAIRLGVTHLGRFAQEYRERFGECPSQTLRSPVRR